MDKNKPFITDQEDTQVKRTFWGTLSLSTILMLIYIYILTVASRGEKTTITYISMAVVLMIGTSTVMGIILTLRRRSELGLKLMFYSLLTLCVAAATLFQGRAISITFSILIISTICFLWVFPQHSRREYVIVAVSALVLIWIIEGLNPAWRQSMTMVQVGPAGAVVFGLIFAIYLLRYSWGIVSSSLRLKITVWTGFILAGISLVLIAYSAITARQSAIEAAQEESLTFAASQARLVRADVEIPLDTARALAQAFTSIKDQSNTEAMSRSQVNAMLRQVLIENPSFLGTYTLWEPNAFDGLDATFTGAAVHDNTGRFIPYWVRSDDGSVVATALVDYETPGLGDWYLLPRQTKTEVTVAPLIYPVQGVDTVMASFVVPILYNDEFYGIAGVDAPIAFVQDLVDQVDLYNGQAGAVLMTSDGTLISVRNQPDLVNQPATEIYPDFAELQSRIEAGDSFISMSPDGQYLRAFAPVDLGRTGKHWSFGLLIPFNEITAPATAAAILQGTIGLILIILALIILWFLSGQIVRPVRDLTTVANAVSQGNLNVTAHVQATDETGVLANAFNLMISQLRESFITLEERVAERTQNLELASEVGRSVSQVRALDVMLKDAAEIIRSRFDLYYVQVYLTNPSQTYLNLQAGTGHVGEELLSRSHRLPLNTGSINGRAATEKRSVIISDTTKSATFRPNPLLPNTRSEMAVPLLIGEKVVGVLDMQSETAGSLNHDLLSAFEALAGQLAIAIQNANLLAETEQSRAEVEAQAQRLSRTNWANYLDAIHRPEETGFVFEQNKVVPMVQGEQLMKNDSALTAPIAVTGEAIGNITVEMEGQSPISRTSDLINTVARQVAQQIESLRLLENAEQYRFEAEEASRRLTREGWKNYKENTSGNLSYLYDLREVRPLNGDSTDQHASTVPLKIRDELIGTLSIQGLSIDDKESLNLATAVAERLSAHIESLRQFDETKRGQVELDKRAQQLAAVAEISTASSKELDIDKMLASVVYLTQRKFDLYHAHIFTFDENTSMLHIAACGWKEGDEHEGTHGTTTIPLEQEQSLVARAARTRQAVIVNDVRNEPGWLPNPLLPDTSSELAVPLVIGDQVLGVLDVQSDRINAFSDEDANIQTTLASQVATALQNARSFTRAQKQAERETTLNLISQKIQSATTVDAVLQIAARELGHALGAPMTIAQLSMKDKEK
ncbi:GAF domain-containing protein [Candidatus Villigracilis affinis]|uniref:GAF domain-containing protein n=1 Tax=Candidatus Villigracilis affinis TaxID=3140682 RepID=UPI001D591D64|nr:GAF domain-containing protein [Anaerolineales bacterium]